MLKPHFHHDVARVMFLRNFSEIKKKIIIFLIALKKKLSSFVVIKNSMLETADI